MNSQHNIVLMQWIVIAVLVVGGGLALWMASSKAGQYQNELQEQSGNITSLREQVKQAKSTTAPRQTPLPEAIGNGPSPSPTATPRP